MAKMRKGFGELEGTGEVRLTGVGGMEIAEGRSFIIGVVDGLRLVGLIVTNTKANYGDRRIGASKEQSRKEREANRREVGYDETEDGEGEMELD